MNKVTIKVEINRESNHEHGVRFFMEGHGDDIVEGSADFIERVLTEAMKSLMAQAGSGKWLIPPADGTEPKH